MTTIKNFTVKLLRALCPTRKALRLGTDTVISSGLTDDVDVSIVTEPSAGFAKSKFPIYAWGQGRIRDYHEFYGKSAHAANPHEGINAVVEAGKMVAHLDSIKYKKINIWVKDAPALFQSMETVAHAVYPITQRCKCSVIVPGETKQTIIRIWRMSSRKQALYAIIKLCSEILLRKRQKHFFLYGTRRQRVCKTI